MITVHAEDRLNKLAPTLLECLKLSNETLLVVASSLDLKGEALINLNKLIELNAQAILVAEGKEFPETENSWRRK